MGAYLSTPSVEKVSTDEDGEHVVCGASSMQGWRMSQEDAHNCCIDFDTATSLFAVYDGHGGDEISTYCSRYLPEFIKNIETYKSGDIKQALIDAFLGFDATLRSPEVIKVLKDITREKSNDNDDSDLADNEVATLRMEANTPISEVISKYKTVIEDRMTQELPHLTSLKDNQNSGEASSSGASSSGVSGSSSGKGRSSGAGSSSGACSSSGAGSSSSGVGSSCSGRSSRQSENNDANVSSSSQQCESASSSASQNKTEAPNSSEADQVLDSTTSNGDAAPTSQVGSSADSKPVKTSQMPDSSEDANEKVSPSKVSNSMPNPSEAEVNGEVKNNVEAADSSKSVNDNECSSSCPVSFIENGEAEQQENISSTGSKINPNIELYKNFLNSDSSDSDSDDENYIHDDFSDDNDDDDDDPLVVEDEVDEDDDIETDDEDEDDEDDDEDDDDEVDLTDPTEEPGIDSGCTAVVAILKGDELYVANAGDSRCVLCRDGEAVELSLDHKPEDQVEMDRIVKAGGKVTGDGRVNGGLNLSRALGDHAYKKNKNLPAEDQMISAMPDVKTITIDREKDEFMVLACDGIWNSMTSQKVINFVRERINEPDKKLSKICEELFDKCLARNTHGDGTGCDNMTAIIVKFKSSKTGKEENSEENALSEKKKRPASPEKNGAEEGTDKESVVDNGKRIKLDEC